MKYVALLRGINVGGRNMIKMADLKYYLSGQGLHNVQTYIQSGNILFESPENSKPKLTLMVEKIILDNFGLKVPVVVLSKKDLESVVKDVPKGWMNDLEWKYNYIFLKPPYKMDDVIVAIGQLKPDIEDITTGEGVLYQSMSIKLFGRTTTGKLAGKPIYKLMTIRNHNTVTKLLGMIKE